MMYPFSFGIETLFASQNAKNIKNNFIIVLCFLCYSVRPLYRVQILIKIFWKSIYCRFNNVYLGYLTDKNHNQSDQVRFYWSKQRKGSIDLLMPNNWVTGGPFWSKIEIFFKKLNFARIQHFSSKNTICLPKVVMLLFSKTFIKTRRYITLHMP